MVEVRPVKERLDGVRPGKAEIEDTRVMYTRQDKSS